ncbi:MAG TPA: 50S ribosomal protein L11 methyltransferase, partial [Chitinophagales bacterium]|nr:50S ribosomal protein L11 methyltransferase [Chitinophagales bacterium]
AGKRFHSILANINKNVLLNDLARYTEVLEKSGNLVISGFFDTDVDELSAKATELGLSLKDKVMREQWAMLHFIK